MSAKSSLADCIFLLAAIIYVDDTDLLHWVKFYGVSDESFMSDIQNGVDDWGMLVQATGGSLKQSKSFWYLLSWKFVRGKPTIKPEAELPSHPLTIPLPDGSSAPIERKPLNYSEETLGVWNNPLNDPKVGLQELKKKGLDWVDCLRVRPLERRDTWLSITSQQYPKWSYGLSSLYAKPEALDKCIGSVYFHALPFLGFNRNIPTDLRTLPSEYQGINLRQWSIEKLAKDLSLLLRHWQSSSTLGQAFQLVYESFQMELGLDGNIFSRPFTKYQRLATHSWFRVLWQYCSRYSVTIHQHLKF